LYYFTSPKPATSGNNFNDNIGLNYFITPTNALVVVIIKVILQNARCNNKGRLKLVYLPVAGQCISKLVLSLNAKTLGQYFVICMFIKRAPKIIVL